MRTATKIIDDARVILDATTASPNFFKAMRAMNLLRELIHVEGLTEAEKAHLARMPTIAAASSALPPKLALKMEERAVAEAAAAAQATSSARDKLAWGEWRQVNAERKSAAPVAKTEAEAQIKANTMPRAAFTALSVNEQMAFVKGGGRLTESGPTPFPTVPKPGNGKTLSRAAFDALTPREQSNFCQAGGSLTD